MVPFSSASSVFVPVIPIVAIISIIAATIVIRPILVAAPSSLIVVLIVRFVLSISSNLRLNVSLVWLSFIVFVILVEVLHLSPFNLIFVFVNGKK